MAFEEQLAAGTCAPTLIWRTASELNSLVFEGPQWADSHAFAAVGTVPARNLASRCSYGARLPVPASCACAMPAAACCLLRQALGTEGSTFDLGGLLAGPYVLIASTEAGLPFGWVRRLQR